MDILKRYEEERKKFFETLDKHLQEKETLKYKIRKNKLMEYNLDGKQSLMLKILYNNAKAKAKRGKIKFDIKKEDLYIPTHCPLLDYKLRQGDKLLTGIAIDRRDPSGDYTVDNVWIISRAAAEMKSDKSKKELITFANSILHIFKPKT